MILIKWLLRSKCTAPVCDLWRLLRSIFGGTWLVWRAHFVVCDVNLVIERDLWCFLGPQIFFWKRCGPGFYNVFIWWVCSFLGCAFLLFFKKKKKNLPLWVWKVKTPFCPCLKLFSSTTCALLVGALWSFQRVRRCSLIQ